MVLGPVPEVIASGSGMNPLLPPLYYFSIKFSDTSLFESYLQKVVDSPTIDPVNLIGPYTIESETNFGVKDVKVYIQSLMDLFLVGSFYDFSVQV